MSDFDRVLERLLEDPGFQRALAANPAAALAGYQLSGEERALLHSQISADSGEDRTVEMRTSKSGMAGLFGPVAAAFGVAAAGGGALRGGPESIGAAPGGSEAMGTAPGNEFLGIAPGGSQESIGSAPNGQEMFGSAGSVEELGTAPRGSGGEVAGAAPAGVPGYHPRVDVDGDGHWDSYQTREGPDGIEIVADMNRDGRADFIGYDTNRDGLVDYADYDNDLDGTLETRMYDDDGDGWMDRSEHRT